MTIRISNLIGTTGLKYLLVLAFVICLLPVGAMAIVYVDSPMVIEEPGEYQLIKDITDYNGVRWQNGSEFYEPCIKILASDVIFDGNGHTISTGSNFNRSRFDQVGIYVDSLLERVSVIDTKVENFNYGIYYYVVNPFGIPEMGGRIENNDVNNNDLGIVLDSSQRISVLNNDASNTREFGIWVSSSYMNIINNNVANNNGHYGILLDGSFNNTVQMNTASNNIDEGIYLFGSYYNLVQSNTANDNINSSTSRESARGDGIILSRSAGNHIINNTASGNRITGICVYPTDSSIPNWVENNTVFENGHDVGDMTYGWGVYVGSDQGTTHVNNNHAFNNTGMGIELHEDNNAVSGGNLVEGNGVMGILLHGSKGNTLHDNIIRNNHLYGVQLKTYITGEGDEQPLYTHISSDSNNLVNNTIYGHEVSGVYLNGTDNFEPVIKNKLTGNDIYNNAEWGVQVYNANLNTIKDNNIHANGLLGIKLDGSSYNVIYNNQFNNTINAGFGQLSNNPNTWNVLQEPGPNIMGGPYKGGNYWAQPNGQGWSQINPDTKGNGFCDNAFVIGPGNVDNFPLANQVKLNASFRIVPELGPYDYYYAPANLTFIDTSTGAPNSWLWQFGDGTFNNTQNPVHTYNTSGNYTISLKVTGSTGGVSEYSKTVSIYPDAIAEIVPTSGVVPLTVKCYDRSTGSPTKWYWEFGDGTNSTQKDPSITFTEAGGYWISLTVTGPSGLEDQTFFWDNIVEVAPRSDFTWYPTSVNEPLSIQFRDASEGSPNNFAWEFGDGATSTEKDPVHIYRAVGNYTVNLTTDSWWSVSNTSTKVISLSNSKPTAAFTMSPASGPFPLTVNFIDQSSGSLPLTYDWDFGDNSTHATGQNPTHTYSAAGTYHITLTVTNSGGQSLVIHDVVVTSPTVPTAAFTMTPGSGPSPLTVQFIDQSSGVVPLTYSWDFGDSSPISTMQSPEHTYNAEGTYQVSLTVTNSGGSSVPVIHPVVVGGPAEPTVAFTAIPRSGTVPLMVSFLDQSTANPDTTTYAWDFGDGATSTMRNPAHQYTTSGSYDVTLTVTVNGIAYPLTEEDYIVVNPPGTVTADFFAVPPSGGIEPVVVQFYDRSTGAPAPTSWSWDFDDPYAPASEKTSTLQSPVHTYTKAGNFTPKLTVSNSQGPNTKVYSGVIYIRHTTPVAAFNASPLAGYTPFSVTFTDKSTGQALLAWDWNFGDGGTSQTQSPVYTYNTPGKYSVTFKSYNDGGWSAPITKTDLITVLEAPPTPPPNIITLYPGWNFVSTPRKLAAGSNSVEVVFANVDMDHHSPLLYDGQTKTWVQFISGTVKPLDGIWVYSKYQTDVTLQFDTGSIPLPPSKEVYRGWNAIGETGVNPISARELLTQVGQLNGNWDTLIGINASTHQSETYIRGSINPEYSDLKFTFPTKGYWLQMNTDDTLEGLV